VEGLYHLRQVEELQPLLDAIPNTSMHSGARRSILDIIRKAARYREAARFLYRTAKKFPSAKRMKVQIINLPRSVFNRTLIPQYKPTLSSRVEQIESPRGRWNLKRISSLLNIREGRATDEFAQQTLKTLREAKVHSEIQLLFHIDMQAFKRPPRVICSSKSACYLCDVYIRVHGKMHTPRCHGRLYPGWRLPQLPNTNEMERRFNSALEDRIITRLNTLSQRASQKKRVFPPPPVESTLLTLRNSVSTLRSLIPLETSAAEMKPMVSQMATLAVDKMSIPLLSTPQSPFDSKADAAAAEEVHLTAQSTSPVPLDPQCPQLLKSKHIDYGKDRLVQGQSTTVSVEIGSKSPLYTAGSLHIQIEYTAEPKSAPCSDNPSNLEYGMKWLTVNEAEKLYESQEASIIDAESLDGIKSCEADAANNLYIACRNSVLQIALQ
jgi:hypothetical protein